MGKGKIKSPNDFECKFNLSRSMMYGIAILINCLQLGKESNKHPVTIPLKLIDFGSAVGKQIHITNAVGQAD